MKGHCVFVLYYVRRKTSAICTHHVAFVKEQIYVVLITGALIRIYVIDTRIILSWEIATFKESALFMPSG
jgi:hypothetical protein